MPGLMPLAGDWPQEGPGTAGAAICEVIGCQNVAQPSKSPDAAHICFSHRTPAGVERAPTAAEERSATIGELLAMARELAE